MEENANLAVQAPQLLSMIMGKREKVIAIVGELGLTFIPGAGSHPFPGCPFRSGDVHDIPGYSHPAAARWTSPAGLQGKWRFPTFPQRSHSSPTSRVATLQQVLVVLQQVLEPIGAQETHDSMIAPHW
jgi:hypothetical protein